MFLRPNLLAVGCVAATLASCAPPGERAFSREDVEAVRGLEEAYVAAWERNDSAAVMATMAEGAILMPSRQEPIQGDEAIRAFWFPPDSPPWEVTRYRTDIEEIAGVGDLAYVRGRGDLTFVWDGEESTAESVFLMIARRDDDGRWKIARRIWTDLRD